LFAGREAAVAVLAGDAQELRKGGHGRFFFSMRETTSA